MLYQSFLIKYAEIGTKGKNRFLFEDALIKQIKHALRPVENSSFPRNPDESMWTPRESTITMR